MNSNYTQYPPGYYSTRPTDHTMIYEKTEDGIFNLVYEKEGTICISIMPQTFHESHDHSFPLFHISTRDVFAIMV
jgi:hypothetical protein